MTADERQAGALVAACTKEARDYILAYARAGRADPAPGLEKVRAGPQPVHAGRRQPAPP